MIEDTILDKVARPITKSIGRVDECVRDHSEGFFIIGVIVVAFFAIGLGVYADWSGKQELLSKQYEIYKGMTGNPNNLSFEDFKAIENKLVIRTDAKEIACSTLGLSE